MPSCVLSNIRSVCCEHLGGNGRLVLDLSGMVGGGRRWERIVRPGEVLLIVFRATGGAACRPDAPISVVCQHRAPEASSSSGASAPKYRLTIVTSDANAIAAPEGT